MQVLLTSMAPPSSPTPQLPAPLLHSRSQPHHPSTVRTQKSLHSDFDSDPDLTHPHPHPPGPIPHQYQYQTAKKKHHSSSTALASEYHHKNS